METIDLKQYVRALKKRWWIIAGLVIIACSLAAVYSWMFVTPVYQAATKLIVNKSDAASDMQINVSEINANILLINTYKEIIRTSAIMDQVVERYPELQVSADQLISRVMVDSVNNSQVMTVSVRDPSYERAMHIVNAVAEVFQESIPAIMNVDNVTILEQAKPKDHPPALGVHSTALFAAAAIVSLMLGIGLCFLLEFVDDSIKGEQDIAAIGLTPLAVVQRMTRRDLQPRNRRITPPMKEAPYATFNQ